MCAEILWRLFRNSKNNITHQDIFVILPYLLFERKGGKRKYSFIRKWTTKQVYSVSTSVPITLNMITLAKIVNDVNIT